MRLQVNCKVLADACQRAASISDVRADHWAQQLLIEVTATDVVVWSTDTFRWMRQRIEAKAITAGRICVPAKHTADALKALAPNQQLTVHYDKRRAQLSVDGAGRRFHLPAYSDKDFPNNLMGKAETSLELPGRLAARLLSMGRFAAAPRDRSQEMSGVLVEVLPHENAGTAVLAVTSTDGARVVHVESPAVVTTADFEQVAAPTSLDTMAMLGDQAGDALVQLGFSATRASLQSVHTVFNGPLMTTKFPPYRKVMPPAEQLVNGVEVEPLELLEAVKQCKLFVAFDSQLLSMELQIAADAVPNADNRRPGVLKLTSEGEERGAAEIELSVRVVGELESGPLWKIPHQSLLDGLPFLRGETLRLWVHDFKMAGFDRRMLVINTWLADGSFFFYGMISE